MIEAFSTEALVEELEKRKAKPSKLAQGDQLVKQLHAQLAVAQETVERLQEFVRDSYPPIY